MNICDISFSCRRSYMAISMTDDISRELQLRTVSSRAPQSSVMRLTPTYNGMPISFSADNRGARLDLTTDYGTVQVCFLTPDTLHFSGIGEGLGLLLDKISQADSCNYIHRIIPNSKELLCINCYKNMTRHLLRPISGQLSFSQDWNREEAENCRISLKAEGGQFSFMLKDASVSYDPVFPNVSPEEAQQAILQDICTFVPPSLYSSSRDLAFQAAYLLWSSIVAPAGPLKREAVLMSKNRMNSVWSWDHCFNALALCQTHPDLAWDQFMIPFDHQSTDGCIPDFVNDCICFHNCVKPPIHGWALRKMMDQMSLSPQLLQTAYSCLSAWTNWWLNFRDADYDGLCEYWHGNDSGWDNSTVFSRSPHVISPELSAFLAVQMDVLGDLALQLGDDTGALKWHNHAATLADQMYHKLFRNDLPIPIDADTGNPIICESMLPYLALLASDFLPKSCTKKMRDEILTRGYLTPYGFASEKVTSPEYLEDGYWRGAVWPPVALLLVDALDSLGEKEVAKEAATAYCTTVEQNGFAENYSSRTGRGLRDRAYTWSASVWMLLRDYIHRQPDDIIGKETET